jgi:hypothetical protein
MKQITIAILMSLSFQAHATNELPPVATCTATVPMECETIQGSEFSTGGGDTINQYIEIDCNLKDGTYKKYLAGLTSWSGFLGLGRTNLPNEISIVRGQVDRASIVCE